MELVRYFGNLGIFPYNFHENLVWHNAKYSLEVPKNKRSGKIHSGGISLKFIYLPPTNKIWDKVMFLYLSVILFTSGGGYVSQHAIGQCVTRGVWSGVCDRVGVTTGVGVHPQYGQPVGGLQLTGMLLLYSTGFLSCTILLNR